jgi:hypothetical protein
MPTYFRFGIGPFRVSQRMGRTKAQQRAAARAADARRSARAERKRQKQYNAPEAVAARAAEEAAWQAAREDKAQRTYRGEIADCQINGVTGGSFVIRAEGHDDVHVTVPPVETAVLFLSLKNRDIVQVTMAAIPESDGPVDWPGYTPRVEEFWHMYRANGAEPRSPANFRGGFPWDRAS